jgi:CRP-like cAMP-binding protein
VVKPDEAGEKLLGILSPGECFGEMSLLTGDPCSATIRARKDAAQVKVYTITKQDFDDLLGRNPVLNRYFSKLLALRLNRMSKQFTEQSTGAVVGELHMIGPTELVQAITVTDRTGTLKVQQGKESLELLFHNGQIWRMSAPEGQDPEETFYSFLTWTRGRFSFEPSETPPAPEERTVHKDTTSLLLEGMRRLDESDVGAALPD